MKTIGLIGGMSWESSAEYYKVINQAVKSRLGGLHSAKCILYSLDFAEIEALQSSANWSEAGLAIAEAAKALEQAGADFLIICTNTMHKLVGYISQVTTLPLLHIADATAERVIAQKISRIGLLGTRFTMQEDFYKGRLSERFGLSVLVPEPAEQEIVHNIIYHELCQGIISAESKQKYLAVIEQLIQAGAEGIILGCTEIELLINSSDCHLPLFPTAKIHAEMAVEYALTHNHHELPTPQLSEAE